MKKFFCLNTLIFFTTSIFTLNTFAQTGGAGVGNSTTLKMWFDANTLTLPDGAGVSNLPDISGNGNDLIQITSSRFPTYTASGLNGLPVLTFDGNDYLRRGATTGLDGSSITVFVVFKKQALTAQTLMNAGYSGEIDKWRIYCNATDDKVISIHKSPGAKHTNFLDANIPTFSSSHFTSTGLRTYKQGTLAGTNPTAYTAGTGLNIFRLGVYNFNVTAKFLIGFIAEVLVYNNTFTNLDRILVENYLGNKYNFSIPSDFYAFESTHNIGLIALANNGVNSQTIAKGNGIIELSGASDLGTNEFFMIAHTNDDLSDFTTTDLPASLPTHQRYTRTWKLDETGEVGNVTLKFDLSGGLDFATSTSYRLLVDTDDNFTDAAVLTGTYNASDPSVSFTTNLADGAVFTLAGIQEVLDIHSITSGLWNTPETWDCTCIPSAFDNVTIEPFNEVTVDGDAFANNIFVDANGILTMDTDQTLSIEGIFDLIGEINFTDGTLSFDGDDEQYFDGGGAVVSLNNVTINNSGTIPVTFYESTYLLNGTLNPVLGEMEIEDVPANKFVINSTSATESGRIGIIPSAFTFSGKGFAVRRFIPAGPADWRNVCSPLIDANISMWDDSIAISGDGMPDGCAFGSDGCFSSAVYYESSLKREIDDPLEPLLNGRGFEIFMGDDLISFSGVTLEVQGSINDFSDIVLPVPGSWFTLGNPYCSPIDFDNITRSGMGNYYYVYDPSTGGYQFYDGASGTGSSAATNSGIIPMGQGFWCQGPGTLTFNQFTKTDGATFLKAHETTNELILSLTLEGSNHYTSVSFVESNDASDNYDLLVDIPQIKFDHEVPSSDLSILSSDELIRKNYIANDFRNKSFELKSNLKYDGVYSISAENIENFNNYRYVYLIDKLTGIRTDLKLEKSYTFHSEKAEKNRFMVIFSNSESALSEFANQSVENSESVQITQVSHSILIETNNEIGNSSVTLFNTMGQEVGFSSSVFIQNGTTIVGIPDTFKGIHILVINNGTKVYSKKVVL